MKQIICPKTDSPEGFELLCPAIGQVQIELKIGQVLGPKQLIGSIRVLGEKYLLLSSNDSLGEICEIKALKNFNAQYGEVLLKVKSLLSEKNAKATHTTKDSGKAFLSPMDGMFYWSASPDSPPFVEIGQKIKPGQTIGLIEVMKCFYPVVFDGTRPSMVKKTLLASGSPVQVGTPLLAVDE